ncbi:MAG TPA: glycosyltransferase [Woeseiaceae bacterium]|nr:glycosyltransferase [Woeseiaceae bacterium]
MLNLLVYSSLFPSSVAPQHGIFVAERLRHMLRHGFSAKVVAPVPWFPLRSPLFGHYAVYTQTSRRDTFAGIDVVYPRYPHIPKFGMRTAPDLMRWGTEHVVRKLCHPAVAAIDAHYFYPDGVAACAIGRSLGLPVVVTARGSDINLLPRYPGPRRRVLAAANSAAAIVAVSDSLRSAMVDLGMQADKIRVIRNGVDTEQFAPHERPAIDKGRGSETLLMVGNLVPEKGHELALKTLARLPGSHLRIAGDGPLRSRLARSTQRLGLGERVTFTGRLSQADLVEEYNRAACLLLTSTREGLPNVVLEAIACGTPVVACDVGGVREAIRDEAAGRIVGRRNPDDLADAVRSVLAQATDRNTISRLAGQFSWQRTAADLESLYLEVLASHREQTG